MNRVLQYLVPSCACQRRERIITRFRTAAEAVEAIIGGDILELHVPSMFSLSADCEPKIEIFIRHNMAPCTEPSEAKTHVAHELRLLAVLLDDCAERLFSDGKGVPS